MRTYHEISFRSWLFSEGMREMNDIIQGGFTLMNNASSLGGAGDKYFLKSKKTGDKYLFKPGAKGSEDRPQQPHADVLGARMSSLLYDSDDEYVAVGYISPAEMVKFISPEIDPKTLRPNEAAYQEFIRRYSKVGGSVQPMVPQAVSRDYRSGGYKELSPQDIQKIQKEQVIDWLISNHDSHGNQFIRAGIGGILLGIDKGQALKYFGSDSLSSDYSPNSVYGEDDPIYNYIFRAAQDGELQVDPMVIKPLLDRVESISDEDYNEMFRPFFQTLVGFGGVGKALKGIKMGKEKSNFDEADMQRMLDMVLARKKDAKRAFGEYYSKMLGQKVVF